MADTDLTQTPDLQSATGNPAASGSGMSSLLDALGSMQGSVSNDAISPLMQGPTQAQRFAQAAAGGVAAMRGQPNPVSQIINDQQKQQMGITEMLMKMSEKADLQKDRQARIDLETRRLTDAEKVRADAKLTAQLTMARETLANKDSSPLMLAWATKSAQETAKQLYGTTLPETMVSTSIDAKDKAELIADVSRMSQRGPDGKILPPSPEVIAQIQRFHGPRVTPEDITGLADQLNRPGAMERWGLVSDADIKAKDVERKLNEQKLIEAQIPLGLRGTDKWGGLVRSMAERTFPNVKISDLTPEQISRTFTLAQQEEDKRLLTQHAETAKIDMARQQELARFQSGLTLDRFKQEQLIKAQQKASRPISETGSIFVNKKGELAPSELTEPEAGSKGFFKINAKELEGLKSGAMALTQLQNLKDTITKVEGMHLTVESNNMIGTTIDSLKIGARGYSERDARTALNTLESQKAEVINLIRAAGDNARAAILLLPAVKAVSPYIGAAGMRQSLGQVENALRASGAYSRTPELYSRVPQIFPPEDTEKIPGVNTFVDQDGVAPGVRRK